MKIISCYSIKGGVGKTTLAVNLAYFLRESGKRVLLVDLDSQGAAGFCYRVAPAENFVPDSRKNLGADWVRENIRESDFPGLDILPSNLDYRYLDILLADMKKSRKQLDRTLSSLENKYDCIVLDCPPGVTLLSENIFRASDAFVVPVIPATLSVRTLRQLKEFLKEEKLDGIRMLPFFSMVQKNKRQHREIMDELRTEFKEVLNTIIPFSVEVENMGVERQPLLLKQKKSMAVKAYRALCQEILEHPDGEEE